MDSLDETEADQTAQPSEEVFKSPAVSNVRTKMRKKGQIFATSSEGSLEGSEDLNRTDAEEPLPKKKNAPISKMPEPLDSTSNASTEEIHNETSEWSEDRLFSSSKKTIKIFFLATQKTIVF